MSMHCPPSTLHSEIELIRGDLSGGVFRVSLQFKGNGTSVVQIRICYSCVQFFFFFIQIMLLTFYLKTGNYIN